MKVYILHASSIIPNRIRIAKTVINLNEQPLPTEWSHIGVKVSTVLDHETIPEEHLDNLKKILGEDFKLFTSIWQYRYEEIPFSTIGY
jgi:hypothetical protein